MKSTTSQRKGAPTAYSGDQEYIQLKYEDWKKKMLCLVCKQRENAIMLQCGHMTCSECIEESFSSRQRVCPVDGKKIAKTNIMKIYWNGLTAEDE
jgi:Zinc finger, C3HC4 type (RING finger)